MWVSDLGCPLIDRYLCVGVAGGMCGCTACGPLRGAMGGAKFGDVVSAGIRKRVVPLRE